MNFKVANIGSVLNLTFPCVQLGSSIEDVLKLAQGQNSFCEVLKKSKVRIIKSDVKLDSKTVIWELKVKK